MSEPSNKPSHQEARSLHSSPVIVKDKSEVDSSGQHALQKRSERKSIPERQKLPQNVYGRKLPALLAKILGPPPLLGDEDPQLYGEFFRLFADEYDPKEITDLLYVIDFAHLHWERLRERRLKPKAIKICQEEPAEESNQAISFIISPSDAKA